MLFPPLVNLSARPLLVGGDRIPADSSCAGASVSTFTSATLQSMGPERPLMKT